MSSTPTGRARFRTTWRGTLVLQVEVTFEVRYWSGGEEQVRRDKTWRDARVEDLHSSLLLRIEKAE